MRYLTYTVAVLISAGAWLGPLALANRLGSWYLLSCLIMVPLCEICWRAHDAINDRRGDE